MRAAEGRHVKHRYRQLADEHHVHWPGRTPVWADADPLNRAITATYHGLYGAAASIIHSLGAHPSLGFIHTGRHDAFVYDLADPYKLDLGLRLSFTLHDHPQAESRIRAALNVHLRREHVLATMARDLYAIIGYDPAPTVEALYSDDLALYDPDGPVPARTDYGYVELDTP